MLHSLSLLAALASAHAEAAEHGKPGLPQLNPEYFASQLFWLAVTFIVLYLLMARSVLPRVHEVLEKRGHRLSQDLNRAEQLSREADEALAAYEELHAETRQQAARMTAEALAAIRATQEAKLGELDREQSGKLEAFRRQLASRVQSLRKELEPIAGEVAGGLVEKLAAKKPVARDIEAAIAVVQGNREE